MVEIDPASAACADLEIFAPTADLAATSATDT
jgi:hypothetical protein